MIDQLDLPPHRELPEPVRAAARARVLEGMRANPGRANRTLVPLFVAAAVVVLAAVAVGAAALHGNGAPTSATSSGLITPPTRQLPPQDTDTAYQVRHGTAPADLAARCLAENQRDPAGRPAAQQWQVLLTATNNEDSVIAYRTPAGPVFCEVTPTTVALSQPGGGPTTTVQPTFITTLGTVAGTIPPTYRAAWIGQQLAGRHYYQTAVAEDGIFLLPNAIPVPGNGLDLGVSLTRSYADLHPVTVDQSELPPVVTPTADRNLPPADQHTAAGQRMLACFHQPDATPVIAPPAWIPGAYQELDDHDTLQLASLGSTHGLLAICVTGTGQPTGPRIIDRNGYAGTDTIPANSVLTANQVFYGFTANPQGGSMTDQVSIVGQLISPDVASVRLTWPGGPNLTAIVQGGTYVLPGYHENDPALRGRQATITAYDTHGTPLGTFPVTG